MRLLLCKGESRHTLKEYRCWRYSAFSISVIICLVGCTDSSSKMNKAQVLDSNIDNWTTITPGQDYSLEIGVRQVHLPAELVIPIDRRMPFPVRLGGQVFGVLKLSSEELLVAGFDTGSGASNPIIALYRTKANKGSLAYVWHRPIPSVYGFNSTQVESQELLLKADYPASGAAKSHHSRVVLPLPSLGKHGND